MKYSHDDGNLHLDDVYELKFVVSYSPNWIDSSWVYAIERVPSENILSECFFFTFGRGG
jgi:hypothetical protein